MPNGTEPHQAYPDEGAYHNMMVRPVSGHDNQRKSFGRFLKGWTETEWEIINIPSRGEIIIGSVTRGSRCERGRQPRRPQR